MLAYDIDMRTTDSHSILDLKTGKRINPAKNISIGAHVWIGSHVVILKGAEIGAHNIVAAGTVVTSMKTEPNVIVAGNPAKTVKSGIDWTYERI